MENGFEVQDFIERINPWTNFTDTVNYWSNQTSQHLTDAAESFQNGKMLKGVGNALYAIASGSMFPFSMLTPSFWWIPQVAKIADQKIGANNGKEKQHKNGN